MSVIKGINVVSISVTDLEAAKGFYGETLGLGHPLYDLPDAGWIEFSCGAPSGNLAVVRANSDFMPSTSTTIVFNVDDCHTAVAELRRRGVRCGDPIVFPGYVTFADVFDPFGNRLQVCSPAPES